MIEGQAWGNLYLTEKASGEFTDGDEEAAVVLADWAAIAIVNARLYRDVRERRDELERTIRGLETTTEISRALGGVTDLERVLELVVKRSRALLDARAARDLADRRRDRARSRARRPSAATRTLRAPMTFRNRPLGELSVFGGPFNEEDERLLRAFAASAATAVATAQNAGEEALRRSLEASEAERAPLGARAARRDAAAARRAADAARRARAAAATATGSTRRSTRRWSRSRPGSATCAA